MKIYADTDIGMVRQSNQDAYYISEENDNYKLCILADGMGGYAGGEVASRLACMSAAEYIKDNFDNSKTYAKEELLEIVKRAMEYSNKIVYDKSCQIEDLEQMGTTLEICLIYNNRVYIGPVSYTHLDVYKRQAIYIVSLGILAMLNNSKKTNEIVKVLSFAIFMAIGVAEITMILL